MIEVVAGHTQGDLVVEHLLQRRSLDLRCRSGEDDALALLDGHLEVAGHVEVLVGGVATLLLLGIFDAAIPVGHEDEVVLLRELHIQIGITGIHTGLDAVVHLLVLAAGRHVLMGELTHRAECQEGTEAQGRCRMGVDQCIANEDSVLISLEDGLLLQDDTTHAVGGCRNEAGIKLTDVLVSVRTECVALILMETQVEFCSMLNDRTVERRQQHVVIVVEFRYGNNQQTVVLSRITVY